MDQNKIWVAAGNNFGPIVISGIHQRLTKGHTTQSCSYFFADIGILITSPNNIQFQNDLYHLTPNDHYMGRTAQLTSRCCILYIYSTNIRTEYFKHAA